ncbi:MAG TPA: hypothetical protein DIT64_10200 [Verrucomicrobiales bacterium]|nr:hypothetical protein [Verrucomicrobiales bacterium]
MAGVKINRGLSKGALPKGCRATPILIFPRPGSILLTPSLNVGNDTIHRAGLGAPLPARPTVF